MGISWGLETRVLELFVIGCLSCSLLRPAKNHKKSFRKVKEKKSRKEIQEKKSRKKDDTKTQHPQIIAYKNPKKSLVLEILSRSLFK